MHSRLASRSRAPSWLLLLLSAACGDDGAAGGGGASESDSGKKFAAICDKRIGSGSTTSASCDEYFSDEADFRIPYTIACTKGTKRCPTAGVVATCITHPEERGVEPFDLYKYYYSDSPVWEETCLDNEGEWVTK